HTVLPITLPETATQSCHLQHLVLFVAPGMRAAGRKAISALVFASSASIEDTSAPLRYPVMPSAWPASPRCLMNAAVGPRKVSAHGRVFHNTAIAVAVLLSCTPLAWAQNPPDKDKGSAAAPAAAASKKPATPGAAGSAAKAPTSEKAQASYSLGVSMGDQLHHLGLSADSISTERL